ncbi:MAG: hypothetical protein GY868_00705 [Deltaproteobacteria bacterium]|nr:hypothetical protein [Deltaproteobacteria bacterium]
MQRWLFSSISESLPNSVALMLLIALCIAAAGCATPGGGAQTRAAASEVLPAAADNGSREELTEIVLPQKSTQKKSGRRRLYSLQMREAEVQDLLLAFAEQTGLNILVEPDISGTVTVDLKKVTLEQALDTVLLPLGLEYTREGNFIRVTKSHMQTRIFQLDYIVTKRSSESLVAGSVGGGADDAEGQGGQAGSSGGYSKVVSSDASDLWTELAAGLQNLKSEEGRIIVNKASNSLIAIDYPREINRIAGFLDAIQSSVQRQVIIEATLMEVSLDERHETGINWGFIQNLPSMSNFQWGLASRGENPWVGYSGQSGEDEGGGGSQDIPGHWHLRPFSGVFNLGIPGQSIYLTDIAEALSTQGDLNILSRPRITTLNNQPAIIKVAREDVFFNTRRSAVFGETTTETIVNFLTIGIVLAVTPQISADGMITMTIHPSVTEKTGEKVSAFGDSVPIIDVRETETVARVRDRQTLLIGGLMQDKITEDVIGLPLLKDIPWIGKLFRHTLRQKTKKELVIMLTPRIMAGSSIDELSSAELARFKELQGK